MRVLYWAGCTLRRRLPSVVEEHVELLSALGVEVVRLGREGCCGDVLYLAGLREEFAKNASRVAEGLRGLGADAVVTGCAGCYHAFKLYAEAGLDVPQVLHLAHVAADLMPTLSGGERVAYHDPCKLGRLSGVFEEPRRAISKVASLVEPLTAGRGAACCGGGGLWLLEPELSLAMAEVRLARDVEPLRPAKLVTACPVCLLNLSIASSRRQGAAGAWVEVVDLGSYLLARLRGGG
ncbi:MAG: (Fe-S)-binding protein [Candidatus Nezhaarchaeales archaeon]